MNFDLVLLFFVKKTFMIIHFRDTIIPTNLVLLHRKKPLPYFCTF